MELVSALLLYIFIGFLCGLLAFAIIVWKDKNDDKHNGYEPTPDDIEGRMSFIMEFFGATLIAWPLVLLAAIVVGVAFLLSEGSKKVEAKLGKALYRKK